MSPVSEQAYLGLVLKQGSGEEQQGTLKPGSMLGEVVEPLMTL